MVLSLRSLVTLLALSVIIGSIACSGPPARSKFVVQQNKANSAQATSPITDDEIATRVADVIKLHNEARIKNKLPSLVTNARLEKAARRHALDMASRKKMTHTGSDQTSPMDRIKETGYQYQRAGENVAYGRYSPERLLQGWMDSPPHRKNILGTFSQIGASCAIAADGTSYWCVTFGLPLRP